MNCPDLPHFPGHPRKNDAVFMYGAQQVKPFVTAYEQRSIEIVHGPSCRREREIRLDRCESDGVPVVERRSGGGTVVLAPGMVVTVIVGERGDASTGDIFNRIHDAMIALLADGGMHGIVRSGISDLSTGGRKILGSSLYMGNRPRFFYYQSSLLVAHEPELFEKYLHHPPREPQYRYRRTHTDFCTSLSVNGYTSDASSLARLFQDRLGSYLKRSE